MQLAINKTGIKMKSVRRSGQVINSPVFRNNEDIKSCDSTSPPIILWNAHCFISSSNDEMIVLDLISVPR